MAQYKEGPQPVQRDDSGMPRDPLAQTFFKVSRNTDDGSTDPSQGVSGSPPNFGESVLPHVTTFQGIVSSVARVYRPSDEALKDSFANARYMRNDPAVMECIEQRQRSVALLDWHIEADNDKDPLQRWLVDEITTIVDAIPRFMQYRENLLHAVWYGRYGVQQRWRWKKIRGKMRCAVDKWLPVNGDKLAFRYDDGTGEFNPEQVGVRVGAGFTTGTSVAKRWTVEQINKVEPTDYGLAYFLEPWEKPLLAIHKHYIEDGEYESPESAGRIHGVGIRSRIYWCWYQKQEALAFLMEFLERSATGMEIWYYPWGSKEARDQTRKAAEERIGNGRNIILVPRPLGEEQAYGVERIEPSMAGADVLGRIITEYFGHQIKRLILGQTLTSEAQSTGLGSGLAEVHLDTYMQIVQYDATNLEETLTTDLIEPLIKCNFPQYADIPLKFRIDTEAPDVDGKLAAWEKAFNMGLKIKAQDVMDLIGATKPGENDEVLSAQDMQGGMEGGMEGGEMPPGLEGPEQQPPPPDGSDPDPFSTDEDEQGEQDEETDSRDLHKILSQKGVAEPPESQNSERQPVRMSRTGYAETLGYSRQSQEDDAVESLRAGDYILTYARARGYIPTGGSQSENTASAITHLEKYRQGDAKWEESKHPRDEGGRFGSGGGGAGTAIKVPVPQDEEPPVEEPQQAADGPQGKYIEHSWGKQYVPTEGEVQRDLGTLGANQIEAETFEVDDSLNIPRGKMPQITKTHLDEFLSHLTEKGVGSSEGQLPSSELHGTQQEINGPKVTSMAQFIRDGGEFPPGDAVLASNDGHILDGHHRWAAYRVADPQRPIDVIQIDLPIKTLLHEALNFEGVGFAGVKKEHQSAEGGPVDTPKPKPHKPRNFFPDADLQSSRIFKRTIGTLDEEMITGLSGGRDTTEVTIHADDDLGAVYIDIKDAEFTAERSIHIDGHGNKFMYNQELTVDRNSRGKGLGTQIFARQVEYARSIGCKYITCTAAGSRTTGYSGYIAWAKMGYDGPLIASVPARGRDLQVMVEMKDKGMCDPNCPETVQELMAKEGGAELWETHGGTFDATFDLDPNSRSSKILDRYLRKSRAMGRIPEQYARIPRKE